MTINKWISGYVYAGDYKTDRIDGHILGFDVDYGYMVSHKGKLIPVFMQENPGLLPVKGGVKMIYPDGVERFIANSWYVDINTDNL